MGNLDIAAYVYKLSKSQHAKFFDLYLGSETAEFY